MDEVAAVENHCGRNGGEAGRPHHGIATQTIREEEQQENQSDSECDRRKPKRGVTELFGSPRPAQPVKGERKIMERGPVILVGVVGVTTMLPKFVNFDSVDGFVVVERTDVEPRESQGQRAGDCQQQRQDAPAIHHLAGSP
jgi:hypothetical protein